MHVWSQGEPGSIGEDGLQGQRGTGGDIGRTGPRGSKGSQVSPIDHTPFHTRHINLHRALPDNLAAREVWDPRDQGWVPIDKTTYENYKLVCPVLG